MRLVRSSPLIAASRAASLRRVVDGSPRDGAEGAPPRNAAPPRDALESLDVAAAALRLSRPQASRLEGMDALRARALVVDVLVEVAAHAEALGDGNLAAAVRRARLPWPGADGDGPAAA